MDQAEVKKMIAWQGSLITGTPAIYELSNSDNTMLPEGLTIDKIIIYPLKVGTVHKISSLAKEIDFDDFKKITVSQKSTFHPLAPDLFQKYSGVILDIICTGIHNKKGPYPDYLKKFIQENFTWDELHVFLNAIMFRMGTLSFINSTILLKRVGLQSSMEIIAMQKNLKSWEKN